MKHPKMGRGEAWFFKGCGIPIGIFFSCEGEAWPLSGREKGVMITVRDVDPDAEAQGGRSTFRDENRPISQTAHEWRTSAEASHRQSSDDTARAT